ncbi:MAG: putative ATPase [Chitinophagales bacterium]|jgi:putative ATPase
MKKHIPLAERMRPVNLAHFFGQQHLVSQGKPLKSFMDNKQLPSMIFWGPPGVGKTTIARILANQSEAHFFQLSAIDSSVKEVRSILETARKLPRTVLFIDEIHRFNKAQQDSLLKAVEDGTITLIGATTENPSFEVISALLSRCQVFVLEHLTKENLDALLKDVLVRDEQLMDLKVELVETDTLIAYSGGDARKLLNLLDMFVQQANLEKKIVVNNQLVKEALSEYASIYDKNGEQHYDTISAFIKSIRGSDPNAALYYLAKMTVAGEDPKFIARRLLILASEDIGNANPNALLLATNCFQAVNVIGYPECELILSQTVVYLATSVKSNASYLAIKHAKQLVKKYPNAAIPLHLRNAPTKLMKELNYGSEYKYAHDFEDNFAHQEFMPKELVDQRIYTPGENPREIQQKEFLKKRWKEKYGY